MTIDFKNNTYTVSIFFKSLRNGIFFEENLWEESLILICAKSLGEARNKAEVLGKSREFVYKTINDDQISIEFHSVGQICEINEIEDGSEIFTRHLKYSEVLSLLTPFDDEGEN